MDVEKYSEQLGEGIYEGEDGQLLIGNKIVEKVLLTYKKDLQNIAEERVYRFFKLAIADKRMAKVMYAILKTRSKIIDSYNHSLYQYNRKQATGFIVDIVIEINEDKIDEFEDLTGITLQTSQEFQGKLILN